MASKKKAPVLKPHGWENHNGGKPPFPGAAPPIHLRDDKKYKGKKGDCP